MKKYIYGNFKMNKTLKDVEVYIESFLPLVQVCKNEVAIFPSFTNLMYAKQKLTSSKVLLGAQNVASEASGAYTGEVSASMLKSVGVNVVLVGHSERRKLFAEKGEIINKKIKESLSEGLKVVLCIGESKTERANNRYKTVIEKQVLEALKGIYENELKNIIFAYEPVWAIGTNVVPNGKQVEEVANIIRTLIQSEYSANSSKNIKVLYGGSVNINNAKQFCNTNGINGLLIGGSSLKPEEFSQICNI